MTHDELMAMCALAFTADVFLLVLAVWAVLAA